MQIEIKDSLENIFQDSPHHYPLKKHIELDVASGSIVSFHVLATGLTDNTIECHILENDSELKNTQIFELVSVPVEENTGLLGFSEKSAGMQNNSPNPYVIRKAPFRTYDAMKPVPSVFTVQNNSLALRIHIPLKNTPAGLKKYRVTLKSGKESATLDVTVNVYPVHIPPIGEKSFKVTNWFSYENIASRHKIKMWSPQWWKMLEEYAKLMAYGRQNTFWIPLSLIFSVKNSIATLDRIRLRKIVDVFTKAGLYYIEGGHVAGRTDGKWEAKTFDLSIHKVRATSAEGYKLLSQIGKQLIQEIHQNNWQKRWIQHIADEPTADNAVDYRILSGMVRKVMPAMPILDATMDPSLVGAVDHWCPQIQEYQKHSDFFNEQKKLGDKVWYYSCCFPGGTWLNRLLDQELLRPLLLGWAGALFNLDGFLHWGLNHYVKIQNPFEMSVIPGWGGGKNALPPGDTHIIYPGTDGPWSSLRFEAQREGFEDYELLMILKKKQPARYAKIIKKVITGFDNYIKSVPIFRKQRLALLIALTDNKR